MDMKKNNLSKTIKNNYMKTKQIIPPPEGKYKPHTLYIVNVTMRKGNPPWSALLLTGFDTTTEYGALFGGYSLIFSQSCEAMDSRLPAGIEFVKEVCEFHGKHVKDSKLIW